MDELPGPLRSISTFPFVGRDAELDALRALAPGRSRQEHRVVLVGGEPGSGKSRLVREFAGEAASAGARVLYGACDAVVNAPYGPFVEALDQLARDADPDELRAALGTGGGELTRLLPDLPARIGDLPDPVKADPDTERHRLHTAVSDLLSAISRQRPVLLVLEDGHWADPPTLLLLRQLARAGADARMLLVLTFRDAEADLPRELAETLADLRRSDAVARLRVGGLSRHEVGDLVRRATGEELTAGVPELARAISDLTDGNAFLVCELWRALVETDGVEIVDGAIRLTGPAAELGTPDSVREVASQRLARLAPATTDLLELAATAGAEFELELLRRAGGLDEPALLAAIEEATRAAMIEELPSRALSYRFAHELVRRALLDRLTGVRRAELHLRVGEALEETGERSRRALADLAHHFTAAAPFGEPGRGVTYNLRAAEAATGALAFEEAAERLQAALELEIEDPRERSGALLDLGLAHHRAGKALEALKAFDAAGALARELGDAALLSRAAIGYEDACWRPGIADRGAIELLEEAATALGPENSELRVGLLAGLARALDFQGQHERGAAVRTSAVTMARELEDRTGLATVLMRSYWSRGSSSLDEILTMLTEAKDLGERLGNNEIRAEAMAWLVPAFVGLGEIESARREVAALRETAEQTAQPFMLHVAEHYGSAIALGDGALDAAEALAHRSREWSRLLTGRDASGVYGIQMFSIRREQGRLAELVPALRMLAASGEEQGPWRPGLVALLAELGDQAEASEELSRALAGGLDAYRESLWLASLTYLTDACAALGDGAAAAVIYPELEPFAGTNVMIGHLVASYGAADRYLGMLAACAGEAELAERHLDAAMKLNRRMGSATWLAHTAYEYGRLLLSRGLSDRERAEALLSEAAQLAGRIGMSALGARIEAVRPRAPSGDLPDDLSPREAQILRLVARGLSNREIGSELFISEHTVANHVRSILRKTDCSNRTEAASYAHRHDLAEG